jgi:hypothetical protein
MAPIWSASPFNASQRAIGDYSPSATMTALLFVH